MNIYHSYFRFWRSFSNKLDFTWIAITKTIPQDYIGCVYRCLAPIDKEFERYVEPVFNAPGFFRQYAVKLSKLDREEVLADLRSFSKNGKDIVLLNWEDMTQLSEGRMAYAWLFRTSLAEADKMNLEYILEDRKRKASLTGENFLEI